MLFLSQRHFVQFILVLSFGHFLTLMINVDGLEYAWLYWQFVRCPQRWWHDVRNQRTYCDWLVEELKLEKPQDWQKVHLTDIIKRKGSNWLLLHNKSLISALQTVYPGIK